LRCGRPVAACGNCAFSKKSEKFSDQPETLLQVVTLYKRGSFKSCQQLGMSVTSLEGRDFITGTAPYFVLTLLYFY
jgi:hypothetical protein